MNQSKRDSAKIKGYEVIYSRWLHKVIKTFGKVTREAAINLLYSDADIPADLVEKFMNAINLDKINFTFDGVLKENIKFLDRQVKKTVRQAELKKSRNKEIDKLFLKLLPQAVVSKAVNIGEVSNERRNFFDNQKELIESELQIIYEKRQIQLDEFRSSFLFDTQDKRDLFEAKYKEPKYKFTDTTSRTQINNLNRDLAAMMAVNVGATEFEWVTSGDERVRESHRKLNNKVFQYNKMPPEYNDYNCRCNLLPKFDFLDEGIKNV